MIACVASYLVLCRWEAGATKGSGSTEKRRREEPTSNVGDWKAQEWKESGWVTKSEQSGVQIQIWREVCSRHCVCVAVLKHASLQACSRACLEPGANCSMLHARKHATVLTSTSTRFGFSWIAFGSQLPILVLRR